MCQCEQRVGLIEKYWTLAKLRYLRWRNDWEPHPTEAEWALDVFEDHADKIRALLVMYAKGYTLPEIAAWKGTTRERVRQIILKGIRQSKEKFLTGQLR